MTKRKTLIVLILSQIIYLLFSVVWLVVLGISAYLFGPQGSQGDTGMRILFYYLEAYPGGLLLGVMLSWYFFAKGKWKPSMLWNLTPLLWVLPYLGIMIYANLSK